MIIAYLRPDCVSAPAGSLYRNPPVKRVENGTIRKYFKAMWKLEQGAAFMLVLYILFMQRPNVLHT